MMKRELVCIGCPLGCALQVEADGGKILSVSGNSCPKGDEYARQEVLAPKRTLTASVRTECGSKRCISVKTVPEIPKDKIFPVMEIIHILAVRPPVSIGDVIVHNIAGTGSDLVATSAFPS